MDNEEDFVEFLVNHIKAENPDLEKEHDDETLEKRVRGGIERAKSHDFKISQDITSFISLMFKIAPNFDEQTEIKAVLDDETTPPDERFEQLEPPLVPDTAWDEAAENYDEDAWNFEQQN